MRKTLSGFTIVELLIVIVVIAILAAITVAAFSGIQDRSRASKIRADLAQLSKAATTAKTLSGKTLVTLTTTPSIGGNNTGTGRNCWNKTNGTDLASLAKTDKCWTDYYETLAIISAESNMNVSNLLDPWGRPYLIDQTEGENANGNYCVNDVVSIFKYPLVGGSAAAAIDTTHSVPITNVSNGC